MHQVALGNISTRCIWPLLALCCHAPNVGVRGPDSRTAEAVRGAFVAIGDLEVHPIPVLECSIVRIVGTDSLASVTAGFETLVLQLVEPAEACGEARSLAGTDFRTIDSAVVFTDSAEVYFRLRRGAIRSREIVGLSLRGIRPAFLFRTQIAVGHGDAPLRPNEAYLRQNPGLDSVP